MRGVYISTQVDGGVCASMYLCTSTCVCYAVYVFMMCMLCSVPFCLQETTIQ